MWTDFTSDHRTSSPGGYQADTQLETRSRSSSTPGRQVIRARRLRLGRLRRTRAATIRPLRRPCWRMASGAVHADGLGWLIMRRTGRVSFSAQWQLDEIAEREGVARLDQTPAFVDAPELYR